MANETPQVPLTTPPPSYHSEISQRPKRGLIKVIFGVVVVILLGAGISLAVRIWDPLWNPFRPAPEKVITEMSKKMGEVKSIYSEVKLDFEIEEVIEDGKQSFKITIKGDSDATDSQNPKSAGDLEVMATIEGMQISVIGKIITIGKDSYIKFTTIPFPLSIILPGQQWIKFEEKTEESGEEITKKLEELLKDKKLYIVKKEFPDEKIGDVNTYHYLVALNKEEIKKLLPGLFEAMEGYISSSMFLEQEELEEILAKLDELFEKIGEITAEIWIGKKDNYLYKIKSEKEIDASQFEEAAKETIVIKAEIDFSNFNQPVIIEPPKDFKTFEEIISPMMISPFLELGE